MGAHSWPLEAGHTLYTLVTAPVATVALLDADVADGLSLLTYLVLRTVDDLKDIGVRTEGSHSTYYIH